MSFRKPFKAVPIKPGPRHRRNQSEDAAPRVPLLLQAALLGSVIGLGSFAVTPDGRATLSAGLEASGIQIGRKREPRPGDNWGGCNDARAAGTAPIYASEPGYREDMDGDGDGVACEPYNGY